MIFSNDYLLSVFGGSIIVIILYLKDRKGNKEINIRDYCINIILISIIIYFLLFTRDKYLLTESHYAKNVSIADPHF